MRIWEKIGTGEVENALQNVLHPENYDILFGPKFAFLPGPMRQAKKVGRKKTIDYQNGRLEMMHGFTTQHKAGYRSKITKEKVA